MCAACVAEGSAYVGTALVSLRVMGARAKRRRVRDSTSPDDETVVASSDSTFSVAAD